MQKIILFILLISGVLIPEHLSAQKLGHLRPKLFTMRNARLGLGLSANGNWTDKQGKNILNFFTGKLPDDLSIKFDPKTFSLLSGGLQFDLYAPNSILSLSFGAGYQLSNFQIIEASASAYHLETQSIQIPAYLKFELGTIHAPVKGLIMAGVIYNKPVSFLVREFGEKGLKTSTISDTYSLSLQTGIQFRFMGDEKEKFDITEDGSLQGEYNRIWIFLRGDLLTSNLFRDTSWLQHPQRASIDYRDLNLTIGVAFFFGVSRD